MREFGQENTEHITKGDYEIIFKSKYEMVVCYYQKLMENPENSNVRLFSIRNKCFEIFKNNKWCIVEFEDAIDDIIMFCVRSLKLKSKEICKDGYCDYYDDILDHCEMSVTIHKKLYNKLVNLFLDQANRLYK